jgi:hypothetical protein
MSAVHDPSSGPDNNNVYEDMQDPRLTFSRQADDQKKSASTVAKVAGMFKGLRPDSARQRPEKEVDENTRPQSEYVEYGEDVKKSAGEGQKKKQESDEKPVKKKRFGKKSRKAGGQKDSTGDMRQKLEDSTDSDDGETRSGKVIAEPPDTGNSTIQSNNQLANQSSIFITRRVPGTKHSKE